MADQTRPAAAICTCFGVRRLARRITQLYDEALKPSGISITQFGILGALRHAGPLSMSDLATTLGVDRTSLTRTLAPLEQAGLVEIATGRDQRRRMVAISEAGRVALRRAAPLWRQAQQDMARHLGSAALAQLHGMLDSAYAALPEPATGQ